MNYAIVYQDDYLAHHGIKGMKWGVRRYQNEDGTLTAAGKKRYGDGVGRMSDEKYNRRAANYGYRQRDKREQYKISQSTLNPVKSLKATSKYYKRVNENRYKDSYDKETAKEAARRYGKASQYKKLNTYSGVPTYVNKKTGQKININDMELLKRNRKEVASNVLVAGEMAAISALSIWAGIQMTKR